MEIDPDYVLIKPCSKNNDEAKSNLLTRIRNIIETEFSKDLQERESKLYEIQDKITKVSQNLHLLRYVLVTQYNKNFESSNEIPVEEKPKRQTAKSVLQSTRVDKLKKIVDDDKITESKADVNEDSSGLVAVRNRILVKRRISIGNISKWMGNQQRGVTHKWMLYIRGPDSSPNIDDIIEKIVVYLHPTYKPDDVVELTSEPYRITRLGWGEFPVRVSLHFKGKLNKHVDVIHNLVLDKKHTGEQTFGNETSIDVHLHDDEKSFDDSLLADSENLYNTPMVITNESVEDVAASDEIIEEYKDYNLFINEHSYAIRCYKYKECNIEFFSWQRFRSVDQALPFLLKRTPLFTPLAKNVQYKRAFPFTAESYAEYLSWPVQKRMASEWFRAKCVLRHLKKARCYNNKWNAKRILLYARAHGYTQLLPYSVFNKRSYMNDFDTPLLPANNFALRCIEETKKLQIDVENMDDDKESIMLTNKKMDGAFRFVRTASLDAGVLLHPERIRPGILYPAVHAVLLQATLCLAENLIRNARGLLVYRSKNFNEDSCEITLNDVLTVLKTHRRRQFHLLAKVTDRY